MKLIRMLEVFVECAKRMETLPAGDDPGCEACPLYKDVRLVLETDSSSAIVELTLKLSPCLILSEVAEKVKERRRNAKFARRR